MLLAAATIKGPHIDWAALSPLIALTAGACVVLLAGLARARFWRAHVVPALALVTLAVTAGLAIWQWDANTQIVSRALSIDTLSMALTMVFVAGAMAAVLLSWRSPAAEEAGEGEYFALLLSSVLGMVVLVAANDLIVLFLGFELLSIPLYVLCATHMRREHSLESGLKYLIIGSVGSATLLYGLALIYGATGSTGFEAIGARSGPLANDVLFLTGTALIVAGLAFKASVAPFHQWTPDVYEGAPTPITGFMAVATKAAAFGVLLRLFDVALIGAASTWAPAFATLAVITIVVGNVGAIGQSSLKRLLAYSSVAQAGYMLAGVVVSTRLGVQATIFYLAIYVVMNLAAFAVITAREREAPFGDDISSLYGLGADRPVLAAAMTVAMLALAGFPATAGFFGKLYLIEAAVDNGYAWLGIVIVLGSAVSLAYYLRVIAAVWMRSASEAGAQGAGTGPDGAVRARPAMAGGSPEADDASRAAGREPGDDGGSGSGPGPGSGSGPGSGPGSGSGSGPGSGSGSGAERLPARGSDGVSVASVAVDDGADSGPAARLLQPEVVFVAVVCAAVTIAAGIYPEPLFNVARDAGDALRSLI
jgi:NADH-quinone oxidoreductase subunit N